MAHMHEEDKPAMKARVLELIADGTSLREIDRTKGLPTLKTIRRWRKNDEEFRDDFIGAYEDAAELAVDRMQEIIATEEDVARARLKIDTIKWTACRHHPKVYGDKQTTEVEHKGKVEVRIVGA